MLHTGSCCSRNPRCGPRGRFKGHTGLENQEQGEEGRAPAALGSVQRTANGHRGHMGTGQRTGDGGTEVHTEEMARHRGGATRHMRASVHVNRRGRVLCVLAGKRLGDLKCPVSIAAVTGMSHVGQDILNCQSPH